MDRKQKEHELFESENKVEKTVRMVEENIKTARMEETIQQTLRMDADSENSAMDESDEDTSLHIGEVITGNYKTTKVFKYNTGEAVIYFCKKNEEKYVAKVYFDNIKPKNKVLEKVSKIKSKYVIPTIEHGVHERTKRYFEIMPFYKNGDLSKKKTYSTDFLIDVVVPSVNEGLRAIHQAQIVHRDIKPNNIFIGNDQSYVVLGDFGISSHIENGTVVKTRNSNRTDGYAAPELYNNFICKENDYFSFGIMLIELVNGEHPFKDLTSEQIMTAVCTQPIPIPNEPRLYL